MKRPLVGLAILYGLGIYAGSWINWRLEWIWVCALASLAAFFAFAEWRQARFILFTSVIVAGAIACRTAMTSSSPRHVVNLLGCQDQEAQVRGVIISDAAGRT